MKTMMLADFLALAKSLPKNVALWALLATGICLAAGNATPIILLTGFPMSHMVLMPMLLRDQRRDWVAFRQALPLSRANVVAGRYASIAVVVAGCVALGVAAYTTACIVNAVVPGLPLVRHFAVGFDAAGVVSFAAGTFALTIAMFSVLLPFMFADSHRKLASYIPFAPIIDENTIKAANEARAELLPAADTFTKYTGKLVTEEKDKVYHRRHRG